MTAFSALGDDALQRVCRALAEGQGCGVMPKLPESLARAEKFVVQRGVEFGQGLDPLGVAQPAREADPFQVEQCRVQSSVRPSEVDVVNLQVPVYDPAIVQQDYQLP